MQSQESNRVNYEDKLGYIFMIGVIGLIKSYGESDKLFSAKFFIEAALKGNKIMC